MKRGYIPIKVTEELSERAYVRKQESHKIEAEQRLREGTGFNKELDDRDSWLCGCTAEYAFEVPFPEAIYRSRRSGYDYILPRKDDSTLIEVRSERREEDPNPDLCAYVTQEEMKRPIDKLVLCWVQGKPGRETRVWLLGWTSVAYFFFNANSVDGKVPTWEIQLCHLLPLSTLRGGLYG